MRVRLSATLFNKSNKTHNTQKGTIYYHIGDLRTAST